VQVGPDCHGEIENAHAVERPCRRLPTVAVALATHAVLPLSRGRFFAARQFTHYFLRGRLLVEARFNAACSTAGFVAFCFALRHFRFSL